MHERIDIMKSTFSSNLFVLILIILQLLSPYIFYFIPMPDNWKIASAEYLFLFIPSIIYILITKQNFKQSFCLNQLGIKSILLLILFGIVVQPSMGFLSVISSLIFPNQITNVVNQLNTMPLIFSLFIIAITPAICEEIAFRGAFASGYDKVNIRKAVLMNGLMFAFLHLSGQQFLYAFVMGVLFAYIVYITNSIFSSMIIHFVFNGSQLILARIAQALDNTLVESQIAESQILQQSIILYSVLTIITIPILYIILKLLIYINRNNKKVPNEITSNSKIDINKERVFNLPVIFIIILYFSVVIVPVFIN